MNWYEVWINALEAIAADMDVQAVLGAPPAIYLEGEREPEVPSMTALLVTDTEDEVYAPVDWQFDLYTDTLDEMVFVEKALRRLLNQPLPVTLGNAELTSEFLGGQLLRGPEPDSYFRRILEFRFTPVRSRYYRPSIAEES